MRVPLEWLAEWVDLPDSQQELEERLTLAGVEIERMERTGPDLSSLRVGHVVRRSPHPNADRLSLCEVDLGSRDSVQIVCGAPNVAAGQRVAVASPGAVLPDGRKLSKARIRGVLSHGMICSERELGLGDEGAGILVLDPETPIGAPLSEVLSTGTTTMQLEITPNRGDWASMLGIAREVRAQFGGPLRCPPCEPPGTERAADREIAVEIEDRAGCYQYVAVVVHGIRVGPSPDWLSRKIEAVGLRSINVVVDVTNLVMLEFGQPIHAFDLHTLRGRLIRVRCAEAGEKLVTLDGQTRSLVPADLLIADAERAVALAGVMGGAETEVRPDTTEVLIESAHFAPTRVRRTARRLGLHSEASYRFERGVDRDGIARAADRAARLLCELAGGRASRGRVEARGDAFPATQEVVLDPARVNRLLGTSLSTEEMVASLGRLEIRAALDPGGQLRCAIPSHRNDLTIAEDLVEEVARIHGYDRIPATLPLCPLARAERPRAYVLADQARDGLCAAGLLETRSFPGSSLSDLDGLRLTEQDRRRDQLRVLNPITEEESHLRTSLIPSLLRATRGNLARQLDCVRLFEVGRTFLAHRNAELPEEPEQAAAVITRGERRSLWDAPHPAPLFFEVRGIAERTLAQLSVEAEFRAGAGEPYHHPGAAGQLLVGQRVIARFGELHPAVARHFEIDRPCALLEIDLSAIETLPVKPVRFSEVSRQPRVRRDLAILLDRTCPAGEVLDAIRKTAGSVLVSVELFDRYEGEGIPPGKVSVAVRLVLQRPDRALTDSETRKVTERVVKNLAKRFGGELRQGPAVPE